MTAFEGMLFDGVRATGLPVRALDTALREGKFEFDHGLTFPHLDVAFAERKHAAHMAGQSDERLFLWSYWVLSEWMKK